MQVFLKIGEIKGNAIETGPQYIRKWASHVAKMVKNPPAMQETWVRSLVGKTPWRREQLPTPIFWPGEFHGLYSPWSHKELDRTKQLSLSLSYFSSSGAWKSKIKGAAWWSPGDSPLPVAEYCLLGVSS